MLTIQRERAQTLTDQLRHLLDAFAPSEIAFALAKAAAERMAMRQREAGDMLVSHNVFLRCARNLKDMGL